MMACCDIGGMEVLTSMYPSLIRSCLWQLAHSYACNMHVLFMICREIKASGVDLLSMISIAEAT